MQTTLHRDVQRRNDRKSRALRRACNAVLSSRMSLDALEPRQLLSTVIAYDFDNDNKPTTVIDDSGNGNNATLPNDALGAFWEAGKTGEGMGFNTVFGPAYLTVGPALFNALSGTGSMSVWVKNSGVGSNNFWETGAIAGMEDSNGGNDIFWGTRTADGRIGFRVGDAGQINSISPINDGRWHQVVMTRDSATGAAALYVDGFLQGSATFDTGVKNSIQFQDIGRITATGGGVFDLTDIVLDDLKIYNNVLSQADVNALYNPGNLPPGAAPSGLTATKQGGTQIDVSWTDNSEFESYFVVERSPTGADGTWTERTRTLGTTFKDNVFFGETWYYRVKAVNNVGETAYSNVANATTDPIADQPGLMAIYFTAPQTLTNTNNAYDSWNWDLLNRAGFRYNDGTQEGSEESTAAVAFNWNAGSPFSGVVPADDFYVRWEGTVTAPATGDYIFRTNSDDGVSLSLDGRRIITTGFYLRGMGAGYVDASPAIHLVAGEEHYIVLEMYERGGGAGVRLGWESANAGVALQNVPVSATSTAIVSPVATNLQVVGTPGAQTAQLTWTDPPNEFYERVELSTDGGTTWATAKNLGMVGTQTGSVTLTNLSPGTSYMARIVGKGAIFDAAASNAVSFTTASTPPGSLTGSQQDSAGDTNLTSEGNLDWVHWGFGGVNGFNGRAASPGGIVGSGTTIAWSAADSVLLEGNSDGTGWEIGDSTHGQFAGQTTSPQSTRILYADGLYGTANPVTDGQATWSIYFPQDGDYKLYVRRKIRSNFGNDNSMYIPVSLDNKTDFVTFDNGAPTPGLNEWGWFSQANAHTFVTAGWHTLTIAMREGGYTLDRLVVSQDQALSDASLDATVNAPSGRVAGGISNFTKVGSGAINTFTSTGKSFTWSNGAPTASATATTSGIATSTTGTGFEFVLPASPTARRANVYVAVDGTATGTLTATLSDASATAFTGTLTGTGALKVAVFSFEFKSGLTSQNLVVNWTKTGGTGNVALLAADWIEFQPPEVPSGLAAVTPAGISGSSVSLSWTDNSSTETAFIVQRSTTSGSGFTEIGRTAANVTSFLDTGVTAGTTYYYRVLASASGANSAPTAEVSVVAAGPVVGTGTGLKGAYYNDDDPPFTNFVTVRIDPVIDFDFDAFASQRPPGFNHDNESVQWTGFVQPQATGWYTFGTASDDQSRVYLNTDPNATQPDLSVENVSNWIYQGRTFRRGTAVFLEAGKKYPIRVDFTQGGGGTNMTLFWKQPGATGGDLQIGTGYGANVALANGFTVVPATQLYTPAPTAAPTAPTGVTITALHGRNVVQFAGIDPVNGETYLVQRSTSAGGPFATVATLPVGNSVYSDADVIGGTTYYYKVVATNAIGQAESTVANAVAIANNLPAPYDHSDIGATGIDPAIPGDASFDGSQYTIISGGSDIWNLSDAAHMIYVKLPAVDTTITARVVNWAATDGVTPVDVWAKIGVSIRESLAGGSRHALSAVTQGNGSTFQGREQTNGGSSDYADNVNAPSVPNTWVRLERVNNQFRAWTSTDGNTWTQMGGTATIPMTSGDQYVGLIATAHNNAMTITSMLDNLTITSADANLSPAAASNVTLAGSATSITVNWTDNSAQETGFKILRSTTQAGTYELVGTAPPNAVSFRDTTVVPGGTYYYRVVATNSRAATQDAAAAQSAAGTANPITNVNFADFSDVSNWQLNGTATQAGNILRMTTAQNDQNGSAFYKTKLDASGFNVSFDLQITNSNGADGMTFMIQNAGLTALGGGGGSLGYAGVGSSVAIKFDFYNNISQTGLYINGGMDDAGYGTYAPVDLESGAVYHVTLAYDGTNLKETIVDASNAANKFEHTYKNVNIPAIIGAREGYFGFSGATGGLNAQQDFLNFSYQYVQTTQGINIVGTTGADTWYVKNEGGTVKVWNNATGTGTPVQSVSLAGMTSFAINGGGAADTLIVDLTGGAVFASSGLNVAGGTVKLQLVGGDSLTLDKLTIAAGASLDLTTNDLIIKNTTYDAVAPLVASARAGNPRWTGPGIGTSSANADQGLALDQVGSDVKIKFTWNGDLNLDGRVNADDYFYIDQGFLQKPQPPKYHDGDFNFDGKINADDYFLIDQAFLNQGGVVLSAPKPALAETVTATKKTPARTSLFSQLKVRKHARRRAH